MTLFGIKHDHCIWSMAHVVETYGFSVIVAPLKLILCYRQDFN